MKEIEVKTDQKAHDEEAEPLNQSKIKDQDKNDEREMKPK